MDLVSFDTPGEFKMFEEIMARGEATSFFLNFGCIMDCALSGMRCEVVFKVGLDSCSR